MVSFLYRVIATVEIVSSGVITIFGVNTFLLYTQRDIDFQREKEMIYYSSIVAVAQSVLTILASIVLIGCQVASVDKSVEDESPSKKRQAQRLHQNSLRRKAIAPTWLAWSLISLASLLFVFIAPIHYCIQSDDDRYELEQHAIKDGDSFEKKFGLCYSKEPGLMPIRSSLGDLYSFSFIGIMFKTLFILLVYRSWREDVRRGKKIMIYVQGCESSTNDPGYESPSSPSEAKLPMAGASSAAAAGGTSGINGGGGDADIA